MGCAPTSRKPNYTPAGQNGFDRNPSALTSHLAKDLSSGKMSKSNYEKLLRLDIAINDDNIRPLEVNKMDYANKEHLSS